MVSFEFVLRHPQDDTAQTIPLPAGEYTLGQSADNAIILVHSFVADVHARLTVTEQAVWLTDLGSQAGTLVNNVRLPPDKPIHLQVGELVEIGWFQLRLAEMAVSHPSPPDSPNIEGKSSDDYQGNLEKKPLSPTEKYWDSAEDIGFAKEHSRYMQYLPAIYDTPYAHRFLALLESMLLPIVWRIDNLDFYLDGGQTTPQFLPWLANWYSIIFDETWDEGQMRQLLQAAPTIFGWWGTARALQMVLDIYVGRQVTIVDDETLPSFTFRVEAPLPPDEIEEAAISRLINQHKPAQTSFELVFTG